MQNFDYGMIDESPVTSASVIPAQAGIQGDPRRQRFGACAEMAEKHNIRHCEQSEATRLYAKSGDRFVAKLLAVTVSDLLSASPRIRRGARN